MSLEEYPEVYNFGRVKKKGKEKKHKPRSNTIIYSQKAQPSETPSLSGRLVART